MSEIMGPDVYHARVKTLLSKPLFSAEWHDLTFPPGWLGLIERLVADIEDLPGGTLLRCRQLKEKWGTLRVYLEQENNHRICYDHESCAVRTSGERAKFQERAESLIEAYEEQSISLCYLCGAITSNREHVWPLCSAHSVVDYHAMLSSYNTYFISNKQTT